MEAPGAGRAVERSVRVVDGQSLFAAALARAIDESPTISWADSAPSLDEALGGCGDAGDGGPPDVLLVDLAIVERTGPSRTREMVEHQGNTRLLVMTGEAPCREHLVAALESGATALLSKNGGLDAVIQAIDSDVDNTIAVGHAVLMAGVQPCRVRPRADGPAHRRHEANSSALTSREHELLVLLSEGVDVQAAARRLGLSVHTCRGHVKHLLMKLGAHSQLEAVAVARRSGLLSNN